MRVECELQLLPIITILNTPFDAGSNLISTKQALVTITRAPTHRDLDLVALLRLGAHLHLLSGLTPHLLPTLGEPTNNIKSAPLEYELAVVTRNGRLSSKSSSHNRY